MANQEIKTTLAITAHPDDADVTAGGTISSWVQEGNNVYYCIVSNGDAGSAETDLAGSEIANIRRQEQEKAAKSLGVKSVYFLNFPDGKLQPTLELRLELATIIRKIKPNRILTHSPIFNLNSIRFSHPDHLAVGQAVLAAVFPDARNLHAFKDTSLSQLEPHSVETVWLMGTPNPNKYVDITTHIQKKVNAVSYHTSQLGDFGNVEEFFLTWGQELAEDAGFISGTLAEAFYVMDTL